MIKKRVTKVVIPVAGLGSRMFPVTLGISKAMLPIGNKPVIQYILEECKAARIEEIIFILGTNNQDLYNFLTINKRLCGRDKLIEYKQYKELIELLDSFKMVFLYQHNQNGLGGAIGLAGGILGNDDFAVILGDNPIISDYKHGINALINKHQKTQLSYIGLKNVALEDANKYGMVELSKNNKIISVKEKPNIEENTSTNAIMGRYVFNNSVLETIYDQINNEFDVEINLSKAIESLIASKQVKGMLIEPDILDTGNIDGYSDAWQKYRNLM